MNNLHIELSGDRRQHTPGAEITGQVAWEFPAAPAALELRLFWYTRGKGTTDTEVVQTVRFDYPRPADRREFRVRLPAAPFSFSGKLISLIWALELVALPSNAAARVEFIVSPTGEEILLESPR